MTLLEAMHALEHSLSPELDRRIYVEPKDRGRDSESARQSAWVAHMHRYAKRVLVFSVPNGTNIASTFTRAKVKREGLYTGFPDTGATWEAGGAYLEWKSGTGEAEDAQIDCLNRLVEMGHPCAVVRTKEAACRWLRSLGAPIDRGAKA